MRLWCFCKHIGVDIEDIGFDTKLQMLINVKVSLKV